jgi:hypothetical protein
MFGLGWKWVERLYSSLPLSEYSLVWLPVSIFVFAAVRWLPGLKAHAILPTQGLF